MRMVLAACFAAILFSPAAAADVPAPHILVVSRAALTPTNPSADRTASNATLETILQGLMERYGANLVIDSDAVLDGASKVDVTAEAVARLRAAQPSAVFAAAPPMAPIDSAVVSAPRILVVDKSFLLRTQPDDNVSLPVLRQLMQERGANLLFSRAKVVYGPDGRFDVTIAAVNRLLKHPDADGSSSVPAATIGPPIIVTIDGFKLMRNSRVGMDLTRQVNQYLAQERSDLAPQSNALNAEGQALQQKIATSGRDANARASAAYEARRQAFSQVVKQRQDRIQQGVQAAHKTIDDALRPIIQDIMQKTGANLLIAKAEIVSAGSDDFDVTPAIIQQLDEKLPAVKLELADAPATP